MPVATRRRATPDKVGAEESSLLGAIGLGEGSLWVTVGLETIRRELLANVMVDVATTGAVKREPRSVTRSGDP